MRPEPDRIRRLLSTKGWLADQPEDLRRQVLAGAHLMERQPGEYVYAMGDAPEGIYALASGRLKFVNYLSTGREVGTWITEPVDWFGEVSMFDRLPRLQSTIALDRSIVLHLPAPAFDAILAACPAFWRNFGLILSGHLRTAMRFLEDVAAEASHIRVGRLLVMMASGESDREPTPGMVVEVSQEQLAATTGLSRQSANKALKRLESEGLVERRYGAVILSDPARLAALGR
ncbi:MAG: Crp/Fnr family transcriptional regulator [Zavarzinia sp.]|nr:Crp/Fnr family transcriptional regulator [Zavarzinia sp.]